MLMTHKVKHQYDLSPIVLRVKGHVQRHVHRSFLRVDAHENAFVAFGGTPREVLYDSLLVPSIPPHRVARDPHLANALPC